MMAIIILVLLPVVSGWAAAPGVFTQPAAIWGTNTMMLQGVVHPEGEATAVWFEWGPTVEMTNRTAVTNISAGEGLVWVSQPVSDWQTRQVHYCQVVASNGSGVVRGAVQMFGVGKVVAWGANEYGQTTVPVGLSNVVAVAAGGEHSLALRRDGTVVAWGRNDYGQTNVPAGLSNVVAVAAGGWHNLALRGDGTVVAWGRNDYGQTNVPAGLSNVVAVAAGGNHSLALRQDGTVVAWGANFYGQTNMPSGLSNVVAVAAGGYHSLALWRDGTVAAWGYNDFGQTNVPAGLSNVVAVAAGGYHSLALRRDGTVAAWGYNYSGQTKVPAGLSNVVAVAGGSAHSLALRSDGTVVAWGSNWYGQMTVPGRLNDLVAMASGRNHSIVIDIDNSRPVSLPQTVYAFRGVDKVITLQGSDKDGDELSFRLAALPESGTLYQYAAGSRGEAITSAGTWVTDVARRVIYAAPAAGSGELVAGFEFVAHDGLVDSVPAQVTVYVDPPPLAYTQGGWFEGMSNVVLRGSVAQRLAPTAAWFEWGPTMEMTNRTAVTNISAGEDVVWVSQPVSDWEPRRLYYYQLVASNCYGVVRGAMQMFGTGRVVAWGRNDYGQTNVPAGLSHVVAVAGGTAQSLALRSDGTVVAWGNENNWYGQRNVPAGLSNVVAVAAGEFHNLALWQEGTVVAWGNNRYGQTNVPAGLSNVVAVAGGSAHSLALRSDGTVVAWGANNHGQRTVPAGLSHVVEVAAGGYHNLALRVDGTVVAWGENSYGQTNVPADLSDVVAVAAGEWHSLALRRDGTVVAWGGQTNVPENLSNVLKVAAGRNHDLAITGDGSVVAWGWSYYGQTIVPASLSNVVAVAGGGDHSVVVEIINSRPVSLPQKVFALRGIDKVITLYGNDLDGDALSFRVTALPEVGTLYQYTDGGRGDAVASPGTLVTDPGRRLIYAAPDTGSGELLLSFSLVANDRWDASAPAEVQIYVDAPPAVWTQNAWYDESSNVLLRGTIERLWAPTAVWFEWGPTVELGNVTAVTNLPAGEGLVWVSQPVEDWQPRQVYYCQVVASNRYGLARGALQMFGAGKVVAWGDSSYNKTNVPEGLSNVVAVAAARDHSLALRRDGTVVGWGNNFGDKTNVPVGLSNAVAVAAGAFHSLVLRQDGTVLAWGYNNCNQTAVPPGLSNVVAVTSRGHHSLALKRDGTVVAWGCNFYGQTNVPAGLSNVVAVAAGDRHSLALCHDGTVVAWGRNDYGQTNVPAGLSNVVAIAAGDRHSLALCHDGTVVAWGRNDYGQTNVPAGLSNVVAIAAGGNHNLALLGNGTMVAWGNSDNGQVNVPSVVSDVLSVAAGESYSLVVLGRFRPICLPQTLFVVRGSERVIALQGSDGDGDDLTFRVTALPGAGTLYQYADGGRGEAITSSGTRVMDPGGRVIYVAPTTGSGELRESFAFIANDGLLDSTPAQVQMYVDSPPGVWTQNAWFDRHSNAVLRGSVARLLAPTAVWFEWGPTLEMGNVTAVTNVSGGEGLAWVSLPVGDWQPRQVYYCQVVASNRYGVVRGGLQMFGTGKVVAWGSNSSGQTNVPVELSNVVAVAAIWDHSLALQRDSTVAVWGDNTHGQAAVPAGLSNVTAVAAGGYHSLALRRDGTVVAWGRNNYGQTNVPAGLGDVVAVAGGWYHCLALRRDGTVVAWGDNNYGQTNMPFGLRNVVAVAAGGHHSLALREDGTVAAWGYNAYGQTEVPAGLSNATALAGGGYHSLALRRDGTVVAWGLNNYGQTNVPAGLSNVVAIAAGANHNLALRADGTVVAWGRNDDFGQADVPAGLSNVVALAAGYGHGLTLEASPLRVHPSITAQPASQVVRPGQEVIFCVSAPAVPPPTYQWWFNGTNLMSEATGPCLVLTNVQAAQAGDYQVVVSNAVGSVTSAVARLKVATVWVGSMGLESGGRLRMALHSPPGRVCEVWATTDLTQPMSQWTLVTVLTNAAGRVEWSEPVGAGPGRFFRLRVPESP